MDYNYTVRDAKGNVTATGVAHARKIEFIKQQCKDNGNTIVATRYIAKK